MGHVYESSCSIYHDGVHVFLCRDSGFCSDPLAVCNASLLSANVDRVHDTCGPKKRRSSASVMSSLCQAGFFQGIIWKNSSDSYVHLVHPYGSHPHGIIPADDSKCRDSDSAHLPYGLKTLLCGGDDEDAP
jgi:hypothetical protein